MWSVWKIWEDSETFLLLFFFFTRWNEKMLTLSWLGMITCEPIFFPRISQSLIQTPDLEQSSTLGAQTVLWHTLWLAAECYTLSSAGGKYRLLPSMAGGGTVGLWVCCGAGDRLAGSFSFKVKRENSLNTAAEEWKQEKEEEEEEEKQRAKWKKKKEEKKMRQIRRNKRGGRKKNMWLTPRGEAVFPISPHTSPLGHQTWERLRNSRSSPEAVEWSDVLLMLLKGTAAAWMLLLTRGGLNQRSEGQSCPIHTNTRTWSSHHSYLYRIIHVGRIFYLFFFLFYFGGLIGQKSEDPSGKTMMSTYEMNN